MKQINCILIVFVFAGLSSFGQVTDTTFYPTRQIRQIKLLQGDKILRATIYKSDGQVKYQWDIEKKELKSFDAINYTDTLAEYFKSHCPDYTLYQHYGNGPIMEIENHQAGNRHGTYQKFDRDGKLISVGQFDNWKKVGIWTYYDTFGKEDRHIHWFHHNYSDGGISINYTIIPVGLALLLILAVLILFLKYSSFSNFFIGYSLVIIGLFAMLYLVSSFSSEQTMTNIRNHVGKYVFPVLATLTLVMTAFSLIALLFKKRTGIKMRFSFLFLVTGIGLCFVLLGAYIGSKMAGAVM